MAERATSSETPRSAALASSTYERGGSAGRGSGAPPPTSSPALIVGVAAPDRSAEALLALFGALPDKPGMSFVVLLQGGGHHDSAALLDALTGVSALPVQAVEEPVALESNRLYVLPPETSAVVDAETLRPARAPGRSRAHRLRGGLDRFFGSLAAAAGERSVGIVLGGGLGHGTAGLMDIKERGGLTMLEESQEAPAGGFSAEPFATAHIDMILPVSDMSDKLLSYARHTLRQEHYSAETPPERGAAVTDRRDEQLLPITELLRHETTHDFRRYRKNTLWRRVQRRMGLNQIDALPDYLDLLRADRLEVQALRRDLLICVTRFFRDPEAWSVLESRVLRELVSDPAGTGPVRVWVPGCATGEEAYTLAILLHEQIEACGSTRRVQIFATDIAEDALDAARAGLYPASIASDLSPERLRRFFTPEGDGYRVTKRLRESLVFAEQNVLAQPPFSRLDLICCRNLLIYLEPDAQHRVMDVFQYALKESGHLFLGNSETVGVAKPLFAPVSKKWRIFRRTGMATTLPVERFGESPIRRPTLRTPQVPPHSRPSDRTRNIAARVQRQLLRELDRGVAVIDGQNRLLYLHGSADLYLQLSVGELSADYPDVLSLAREGLRTKLKAAMRQVRQTHEPQTIECRVLRDSRYRKCAVTIRPLEGGPDEEDLLFASFEPLRERVSGAEGLEPEAIGDAEGSIVAELQQELASTREQLNSTIEDLEAANDALRASNEEAISMNEELQSGNEELETSKEELQSLNEELTTLNHQLEMKVAELQATTNDLDNLLTSSHVPTIFLDTHWRIRRFTPSCTGLFNLIENDVGRPLTDIAATVADPHLLGDARAVLENLQPRERQIRSTDGTHFFQRRILPYRTGDDRIEGVVVTFADVTDLQRKTLLLRRRERQQKALANLGQRALVERDMQTLMDVAVRVVQQTFQADFVKLLEVMPDGRTLLLSAGIGWREGVVGQTLIEHDSDSQAAYTLSCNQPVVVTNLRDDPRFKAPKLLLEHGVVSGISTIIRGTTAPIGVLGVHTKHPATFTHDDVDFMESVAHILSGAIQRARGEEAIRAAEERLRLATAANNLGTWDYDPQSGTIVASARAKELFGLPRDAVVRYETHRDMIDPRDRRRVEVAILRTLDPAGTGRCDIEYRTVPAPDGTQRWIRDTRQTFFSNGRPVRVIGALEDVTVRKEAEQANVERLQLADQLELIAEATPGTIFTFRVFPDGSRPAFPYTSPHVRDTWGVEPEEIADDATPLFNRIPPEDNEKLQAVTIESMNNMSMWHAQFRYNHPTKGDVWLESYASPMKEADGSILWHGIAHDITETKTREMELLEARRVAEAADRAKGEFLANMSHEIRTPMSAILGYTEILSGQLENPDNLQHLDTIRSNGMYLLEIIDDILDLSRIEAGKLEVDRERVRPESLVWEVQSLMKLRAGEKGLGLDVEFAGRLPETIETDATRVRQILINLVENAIKFTEQGGVRIRVQLIESRSLLRFDVIDTGIGISDDTLSRLFKPFTQADTTVTRRFGGSGLGLSICRALAKLLGGDVSVETRIGEGSTFTLTIAAGDLSQVQLFNPSNRAYAPATWREDVRSLDCNVLVVDDRRDMRYLAQHMLEEAGAQVALASDGRDALHQVERAAARGKPFDAVILDMQMPVLDGYAAARELRRRGFDRPIIALTANAMREDEKKCLENGCDDYLSKPLARATLVNTLAYYTQEVSVEDLAARRSGYSLDTRTRELDPPEHQADGGAAVEDEEPAAEEPGLRRVLIVDDNADSCALLKMLLETAGWDVAVAQDGPAALAAVEDGDGAPRAAIIDLGLPGMPGEELVSELKARPSLASCLFVCLSGRSPGEIDWKAAGFDHFVRKPARFAALKEILEAAVGARPPAER
ncbi:MAG: response regulator [Gammaproteobacteria bacterium]|nr:response regulator [Gammaproteobacteria bacterium]